MSKPVLEVFGTMGKDVVIGYQRTDVPMAHELARAPGGALFQLTHPFSTCSVCVEHKVTAEDFDIFMSSRRS